MKCKKNLIIIVLVVVISLMGVTYAFFEYFGIGANQKIAAGKLNLILNEGTDTIDVTNIFPETSEKARSRKDNQITFTVSGINTTTNQDIYYEIMLNEGDEEAGMTRFNPEDLVFDLVELNEDGTETFLVDALSYNDFNERRLWVNTVERETSLTVNKTSKLRMWLDEDVIVSDTDPNASYSADVFANSYASVKVSVYGDFVEKSRPYNYMVNLTNFTPESSSVSEIHFIELKQDVIETRYAAATLAKADITDTTGTVEATGVSQMSSSAKTIELSDRGNVKAWLELDSNDSNKYIMYIASDGITFFPSDCTSMFAPFVNVNKIVFENINTRDVTNMTAMFSGCTGLTKLDLSSFDTSNVTNMQAMFQGCVKLINLNINNFNTSKVMNMAYMFNNCQSLESLNVSSFNTSSVTDMQYMFTASANLLSLDLSNFDTSKVTNFSTIFCGCTNLSSLNLSGWTIKVSNFQFISYISGCSNLTTVNLSNWDVSSLTSLSGMFAGCITIVNLDLSYWNSIGVTDMSGMFNGCTGLTNLDLSSFDTSKVTNAQSMFYGCTGLTNLSVKNLNFSSIESLNNFGGMFGNCTSLETLDLSGWNLSGLTSLQAFSSYLFGINSGSTENWNLQELNLSNWNVSNVTDLGEMFSYMPLIIINLSGWNTSNVTHMSNMFYDCSSLTSINFQGFDTSNVTIMQSMFYGCTSLEELNLSHFDTSGVTDMSSMFAECKKLTNLDISGFTFDLSNTSSGSTSMFQNMPDNATVRVGNATGQTWILGLETPTRRPVAWTTTNVIIA